MKILKWAAVLAATALLAACNQGGGGKGPGNVDGARIAAASDNGEWLTVARTYDEQRHSPLDKINTTNVGQLGLAWMYEFDTDRGQEATPVVVDGVLYTTTAWSKVYAFDAKTGALKWSYDPKVEGKKGFDACCDVVNRGVALYQGKVFVASYDGRLIALDAGTGRKLWEKDTIIDRTHSYTITGAPRVFKGKVIIGNGGAEYGVRGYITAYDAGTGEQKWRWFTVPGDPSKPFEDSLDPALRERFAAVRTKLGQPADHYKTKHPLAAALILTDDYREKEGLTTADPTKLIKLLAERGGVKVVQRTYDLGPLLGAVIRTSKAAGAACLDEVMGEIEAGPGRTLAASRAWAQGDVVGALGAERSYERCIAVTPGAQAFDTRVKGDLTKDIEAALKVPGHAIAVAPLRTLLAQGGVLDQLRAKGYEVKTPGDED